MNDAIIQLNNLQKIYTIHEREAGMIAAMRSLFRPKKREVRAVDQISFEVAKGEIVGLLGPNGSGKTTTLKMLSGLLHPTSGSVSVAGFQPFDRDSSYLRQMALVMGQRHQLMWDIPPIDSYELGRIIYRVPEPQFRETLNELVELLELAPLINKPVRNLSLGERMKCEIAGVLLHRPKVLFLDEPTIGLDVGAQRRIREFIAEYNRRHQATIMLTSHYMADVEALCKRVIVINQGKLLFDGALSDLVQRFAAHKKIVVDFEQALSAETTATLANYGTILEQSNLQATLQIPKADTAHITSQLLTNLPISDVTIQDPPIEDIIEQAFQSGKG